MSHEDKFIRRTYGVMFRLSKAEEKTQPKATIVYPNRKASA